MGLPNEVSSALIGAAAAGGYEIEQSLRFDGSNGNLSRTFSASNRKTWTWSAWVKRSKLGANQAMFSAGAISGTYHYQHIQFNTDDKLQFVYYPDGTGTSVQTSARFRDPSAWYHIVAVWDTTQATASNRAVLYVNGERQTDLDVATYSAQNTDGFINSTAYNSGAHYLGRLVPNESQYFGGYMAEVHFVDGSALDPTDFGEFDNNGVWRPISFTGSHGTTGFYLDFSNTSVIGEDQANSNDWTANNITTSGTGTDVLSDTPTNNFPTFNPLALDRGLNQGNLVVGTGHGNGDFIWTKTIAANQGGNYYWEYNITSVQASSDFYFGVLEYTDPIHRWPDWPYGVREKLLAYNTASGNVQWRVRDVLVNGNAPAAPSGGWTIATNDVIGVRLDIDNDLITISKNGTVQTGLSGYLSSDTSVYYTPATDVYGNNDQLAFNAGQRDFSHQPTGTTTLCTANLATPNVANPGDHFNTVVWSGNDSTQSINNVGFQPDLVWVKNRNNTSAHMLFDSVRGVSATSAPGLSSNQTSAEVDYNGTVNNRMLTSLDSSGFSVGADQYGWHVNKSGRTYVAWCWKAGNGTSSNTSGTITSTVSANPTAGFSIVSYTGTGSNATVGHGLGVAPSMIIIKNRVDISSWQVYHSALGPTKVILLESDGAAFTSSVRWNNTAPTSTVFTIGTDGGMNGSSDGHVAYCFAQVEGYSKFGSYTGNGSNDGPFVYCGFRPAFVCLKGTGFTSNWNLYDSTRSTYNLTDDLLRPNLPNAEVANYSPYGLDILSNGFKLRTSSGDWNSNTQTFLFMAFAENPFGGDGVSPSTAR